MAFWRVAVLLAVFSAFSTPVLAADGDGDGYDESVDCNDADSSVNPGATEVCDAGNVDEDCDSGADDADPQSSAIGNRVPIYADADGDGYGSGSSIGNECDPDANESTSNTDCLDSNPSAHPGGTEVCDAGNVNEDCDSGADDADPQSSAIVDRVPIYADLDGDGYGSGSSTGNECDPDANESTNNTDCLDSNPGVHPGGTEVCDAGNVDEDCDTLADDSDPGGASGKTQWYADADVDGYGAGTAVLACDQPPGKVANDFDCDDGNDGIPGTEICDPADVDEDCDGFADDNDSNAFGETLWYPDADGDGYGIGVGHHACNAAMGEVATAGDCDDGNAAISPGDPEICDEADVDEDCDTLADDNDPEGASGKTQWYADADADGFGAGIAELRCSAPPGKVATAGDCDDANDTRNPGEPEACDDTVDNNCDLQTDCTDATCSADAACTTEVFDHLECFKIKSTEKLKGTVNLDPGATPPFTLASGCTIKKASKYCVPVTKTVSLLETTLTPDPGYVGAALTDQRICYKVKCPAPAITTVDVHDQFGTHTFEKFKVSEVCTPAEQVP